MSKERVWSEYQKAVFGASNEGASFVVNAVAGSGKSTTMVEVAKRSASKGVWCSMTCFNKDAAEELKEKTKGQRGIFAGTMHSFGMGAIHNYYRKCMGMELPKECVDDDKWRDYLDENLEKFTTTDFEKLAKEWNEKHKHEKGFKPISASVIRESFLTKVCKVLRFCRQDLIRFGQMAEIEDLAEHHSISGFDGDELEVVNKLLAYVYTMPTRNLVFDYIDMITLPLFTQECKRFLYPKMLTIVDECQDLNTAQRMLAMAMTNTEKGGKVIAVGDPKQAINGFAGAKTDSFELLKNFVGGKEMPLSVCYRCGKNIVAEAQELVPNIMAHEGAEDGEVNHVYGFKGIASGDMVLCRTSADLVKLALKMLSANMPCKVKGKDIMRSLKAMLNATKKKRMDDAYEVLTKEYERIVEKASKEDKYKDDPTNSPQALAYKDKVDCIKAIADACIMVSDAIVKMDTLFGDAKEKGIITLSTIHKSKGLEADRVWIIRPHKLPLVFESQQDWEYEQELNLKYVAITRAKKVLNWVDLSDEELDSYQF